MNIPAPLQQKFVKMKNQNINSTFCIQTESQQQREIETS